MDVRTAEKKKDVLSRILKDLGTVLVAFSGGVDSTFLLAVAHQVLKDDAVAATATSVTRPSIETDQATRFTKESNVRHIVFPLDETCLPEFVANNPDRCYHCKKHISQALIEIAEEHGLRHVAHAANLDDYDDYRPGLKAAEEMGIAAPLVEAKLTKEEIRFLSKEMGLTTWDQPSMACLASRIPYGDPVTVEKIEMVRQAEAILAEHGFKQYRVRHHGPVARIEVDPSQMERLLEDTFKDRLIREFKRLGFAHVAVDLEGYVSGSMNRTLEDTDWAKCEV